MKNILTIENEELTELLFDYASGATNDAMSLVLASYLTLCPEARAHFREFEKIGAALFEHCCDLENMSKDSLSNVLGKIDNIEDNTSVSPKNSLDVSSQKKNIPIVFEDCNLPQAITVRISSENNQNIKWKTVLPGIELYKVPVHDSFENVYLIRMQPGKKMIAHTQKGKKITLVVEGSYSDETGTYNKGDIIIHEHNTSHTPLSHPERGCTILSIMDGPIKLKTTFSFIKFFIRT